MLPRFHFFLCLEDELIIDGSIHRPICSCLLIHIWSVRLGRWNSRINRSCEQRVTTCHVILHKSRRRWFIDTVRRNKKVDAASAESWANVADVGPALSQRCRARSSGGLRCRAAFNNAARVSAWCRQETTGQETEQIQKEAGVSQALRLDYSSARPVNQRSCW